MAVLSSVVNPRVEFGRTLVTEGSRRARAYLAEPGIKGDIMSINNTRKRSFLPRRSNPMSIKTKVAVLASSAAVLVFMVVGGLDGVRASSNDGAYRQLQVYSEV